MIITCPSCGTRYRQPQAAVGSTVTCSCSRCEATFSSDARAPRYSVHQLESISQVTGPAPMEAILAVGARLEPEAAGMASPVVLPLDGPYPEQPAGLSDLPIGMDDPTLAEKIHGDGTVSRAEAGPPTYFSVPAEEDESVDFEEETEQVEPPLEDASEPERLQKDTRPGFGAFMMVTCLPTAMAAGAWQLSTMFAEDPTIWATPAGVLGLLFSWLWVRWKYRER